MPIIDLGKLKFHFAGSWSTVTNYEKDDVVLHRQQTWVGLGDSYNQIPEDGSTYWERMTGGLNFKGNFDVAQQYYRNDMVKHGNAVYLAIADKPTLGTQTSDTSSWTAIGSWSGTAVTENAGDMVFRDANGEEKPLAAKMLERGRPEGLSPIFQNINDTKGVKLAHQLALTHSADQEEPHDTKQKSHTFKVVLDDNDNPTGYMFYKSLKGAQANVTTEYEVRWNSTDNKFEMREKLPQPDPTTTTYVVTVSDASGSNKYLIDGVETPTLTMTRGSTYIFQQYASSNDTHQIEFKTAADVDYTDGVTTSGTAGDGSAVTTFVVPMDAPDSLKYACETHGNAMGNTITVVDAIPFEQNKQLSVRRSGHYRGADMNFHRLRFDMSHASLADDGQGNSDPIRLRFATISDGNHNSAATYTDRSALANNAYFVQSGTAPADDFTEELYAKVYTNTHDGTWWNNKLTYYGTPGTAGAFVEIWQDYNDNTALDVDAIYYFEEFNSGAGGVLNVGFEKIGLNPALKLHRWHEYRFSVSTVGTSANHPFYIKNQQSLGTGDQINTTITGNGTDNGTVVLWIGNDTTNHPDTMYYVSSFNNTDFSNTITATSKIAAPAIVMPDNEIIYDGAFHYNSQTNALDLYWDKHEGWREFSKLTLTLQDGQPNDDTDQSMYVRWYHGPGDGHTYTRLDASYYYAWQAAYGTTAAQTQSYGNNLTYCQFVWDTGSNNREQFHTEMDIYLNPKAGGNAYGTPASSTDNDNTYTMDGGQRYYDGTDRVFGMQWRSRQRRDNAVETQLIGACSNQTNLPVGNVFVGMRIYSNSGNIANLKWQLRGHR